MGQLGPQAGGCELIGLSVSSEKAFLNRQSSTVASLLWRSITKLTGSLCHCPLDRSFSGGYFDVQPYHSILIRDFQAACRPAG